MLVSTLGIFQNFFELLGIKIELARKNVKIGQTLSSPTIKISFKKFEFSDNKYLKTLLVKYVYYY